MKSAGLAAMGSAPSAWHEGQPIGSSGRLFNLQPVIEGRPDIEVRRPKPGPLLPIENPRMQQPHTARFELPGSRSRMAEVAGDPRLDDSTVAAVAANRIGQAFLNFSARKAARTAQQHQQRADAFAATHLAPDSAMRPDKVEQAAHRFMELGARRTQGRAEDKRVRAAEFTQAAARRFGDTVTARRAEIAQQASQASLELMSSAGTFKKAAKSAGGDDFRQVNAEKFEQAKSANVYGKEQQAFINRMESMAPQMRGAMYFGAGGEHEILGSGGLFAKHTRQQLGMSTDSKTTDMDMQQLGNHDHVFFFLEHQDTGMRTNSRFAGESSASGLAESRALGEGEHIASGSRRISFPLANLMQQGSWAMKQDFLSPELGGGMKELQQHENFVMSREADPDKAAGHFMRQLAISALDMPGLKGKTAAVRALNAMDDRHMSQTVFHDYLRPQLMVPSVVNLNTRGAILDMPIQDAGKK